MEHEFEQMWRNRESHLDGVPGFHKFNLIKGSKQEDHHVYASHSVWDSEELFYSMDKIGKFSSSP